MMKYYVKMESRARAAKECVANILKDQRGFGAIEWILLVVIIAGAAILLKPLITATFTKIAGLWDTELVNKFNGSK